MPVILLYDTSLSRNAMYPLALTRPVCDIRHGILTIREWWQKISGLPVYAVTESYLPETIPASELFLCADASVIPSTLLLEPLKSLKPGMVLEDEQGMIAFASETIPAFGQLLVWPGGSVKTESHGRLTHASHLFQTNADKLRQHYQLLTAGRPSAAWSSTNTVIGNDLFLEAGVTMEASVINTQEGPVYIGENALVMEGALLRGPLSVGAGAVVKMGAKIYPGTTVGPGCTVGGEIKNSILLGYSNKAHDGYLGDSVIGEWCNFGAGSSNSNVKNTGGDVKMWDQQSSSFVPVGNKAGLLMGDYSRCAINSSINTGTTIGVNCNVFDGSYPLKHLPSFSWGNYESYQFEKACRDAANWKKMKSQEFTAKDRLILQRVFENVKM